MITIILFAVDKQLQLLSLCDGLYGGYSTVVRTQHKVSVVSVQ